MSSAASPTPRRERIWLRLLFAGIALISLWSFPYLEPLNNPNENVRLYVTVAMADHGTFAIGYRQPAPGGGFRDIGSAYDRFGYVNDKAIRCDDPTAERPDCAGTLYAGKAPGVSVLAVPFYMAVEAGYHLAGRVPTKAELLFWMRLFVSLLPVLLLLYGLLRYFERHVRSAYVRGAVLVGLGLGSMLFSYAPVFAGHSLSAALLGGAWLLLDRHAAVRRPAVRAVLAGALAATAIATEYPSAIGAGILFFWLIARQRRSVLPFMLGGAGPLVLLALYHHVVFGAPWATPYSHLENVQFIRDIAPGFMGVQGPQLEGFLGSFFAPFNGLFFFAPWLTLLVPALFFAGWWRSGRAAVAAVLMLGGAVILVASFFAPVALLSVVALIAAIVVFRRGPRGPRGLGLYLTIFLAYGLFITSHSLWRGGWTVGPRYIVMMMPFAGLAIATAADRWMARAPRLTATALGGLVLASVLVVVGTGQVSQGYPPEYANPVFEFGWVMLRDGWVFPNAGHLLGLTGLASLLPVGIVLAVVAGFLLVGRFLPSRPEKALPVAPVPLTTLALAALTLAVLAWSSASPWSRAYSGGVQWQRSVWPAREFVPSAVERDQLEQAVRDGTASPADRIRLGSYLVEAGKQRRALILYRQAARTMRTAAPDGEGR